jgi:hypothetical protein
MAASACLTLAVMQFLIWCTKTHGVGQSVVFPDGGGDGRCGLLRILDVAGPDARRIRHRTAMAPCSGMGDDPVDGRLNAVPSAGRSAMARLDDLRSADDLPVAQFPDGSEPQFPRDQPTPYPVLRRIRLGCRGCSESMDGGWPIESIPACGLRGGHGDHSLVTRRPTNIAGNQWQYPVLRAGRNRTIPTGGLGYDPLADHHKFFLSGRHCGSSLRNGY